MASKSIILLMGVSGCGKTTIGKLLSQALQWPFYDGDEFQPKDNLNKMAQGLPLNDRDRRPWLMAMRDLLISIGAKRGKAVLACSALKQEYRDLMTDGLEAQWVYLKGEYPLLEDRLQRRQGHFFKASLLGSQFEILEEPADALVVPVDMPPDSIIASIRKGLGL